MTIPKWLGEMIVFISISLVYLFSTILYLVLMARGGFYIPHIYYINCFNHLE